MSKDQPSGWENELKRREKQKLQREEEAKRRAPGGDPLAAYKNLGEPPLDDPTKMLIYAQNCIAVALREVTTDPVLNAPDRWKLISELGGKIGMTHAKALVQSKLDKVTKKLADKKDVTGGPKSLAGVAKPAATRRGTGGERIGQNGRSVSGAQASEDSGDASLGGGPVGSPGSKVR